MVILTQVETRCLLPIFTKQYKKTRRHDTRNIDNYTSCFSFRRHLSSFPSLIIQTLVLVDSISKGLVSPRPVRDLVSNQPRNNISKTRLGVVNP